MKNWLYIPFLLLMSITYTRLAENYNSETPSTKMFRMPASVEVEVETEIPKECLNIPNKFNPHYFSNDCL
jgi:hypothetical protein